MAAAPQERMSLLRLTTTVTATSNIAHEATSALRLVEVETFRAKSAAAAASNLVGAAIASAAVAGSSSNTAASTALTTPDPMRTFTGPCANHSAYVRDGQLFAWGANGFGQLGLGDTTDRFAPTRVPGIWDAVAVGCGAEFTVVLRSNGTAVAMGANARGQLGDGTTTARLTPTAVLGVMGATLIAVGASHVLFLNGTTGTVAGYGSDSNGQLGDGSTNAATTSLTTMTPPSDTSARVMAIAAGASHSFIVLDDGTAYGFGANANGQLGLGDTTQRTTPAKVLDVANVVGAACGQRHTLLIRSEGQVLAAGDNAAGQLGRGTKSATPAISFAEALAAPTILSPTTGSSMRAAAGDVHSVVMRADGSIWAFGGNANGQLGTATMAVEHLTAVRVATLHGTMSGLGAGAMHTVLLRARDLAQVALARVFAAGLNSNGQVGDVYMDEQRRTLLLTNGGNARRFFVPIPEALSRKRVGMTSSSNQSCYVDADGTVYTWGFGGSGQLGHGDTSSRLVATPVAAPGNGARFVQCSIGSIHMVALDAAGSVYTWGYNTNGQLGNNTVITSSTPVLVSSMGTLSGRTVAMVAAGGTHTLALDSTGAVHAWGDNSSNQLGDGTATQRLMPQLISGGTLAGRTVVAIAASASHSLALDTSGTIHAWGSGSFGQLGDDTVTARSLPVTVLASGVSSLNERSVVAIAAGQGLSYALDSTGVVHAWGANSSGQLGDGTLTSRRVPVLLSVTGSSSLNGRAASAIAAGNAFAHAVDSTGAVHVWGLNSQGQLGDGSSSTSLVPKEPQLSGRTFVAAIASNGFAIYVDTTGSLWAVGTNGAGQLGTNNTGSYYIPAAIASSSRDAHAPVYSRGGLGDHKLLMNRNTSNAALLQVVGANAFGQLGTGSTFSSSAIASLPLFPSEVVSAASGLHHSGAVLSDGSAYLWGRNHMGQCGLSNLGSNLRAPALIAGTPSNVEAVACGTHCTFMRIAGGAVAALGDNTSNQLGLSASVASASNPTLVPGLSNVTEIVSGSGVTLAVDNIGRLFTWGTNANGNTGRGTTVGVTASPTFVGSNVFEGLRVRRVAVGDGISAAVTDDGGLYTCGMNLEGALGFSNNFGTTVPVSSFTRLLAFSAASNAVVDVVCGPRHMVVQLSDNTIRTFGRNNNAQRGILGADDWRPFAPVMDRINAPQRVATTANMVLLERLDRTTRSMGQRVGGRSATPMTSGGVGSTHSAVITPAGELHVWGGNSSGQLGDGTTTNAAAPINLSAAPGMLQGKRITAVAVGASHTVALDAGGTLYAWGSNNSGQLGDGTSTNSVTPVQVSTTQGSSSLWGRTVVAVTTGGSFNLALDSTGAVHAWGDGTNGQLGDGSKVTRSFPVLISGGSLMGRTVAAIAAGSNFVVALDTTGQLHVWGQNGSGQLGIGSTGGERLLPVQLTVSGRSFAAISCGNLHTLALDTTSALHSWGANSSGQLGDATTTSKNVPSMTISGTLSGRTIVNVSAANDVSMALDTTGALQAWGSGSSGALGNLVTLPSSSNVLTPATISANGSMAGRTITSISVGGFHSVALDSMGALHSWGAGVAGQLGNGPTADSSTPASAVTIRGSLSNTSLTAVTINLGSATLSSSSTGSASGVITPQGFLHVWGADGLNAASSTARLINMTSSTSSLSGRTVISMSSGSLHVLVLDSNGAVHAWGQGTNSQIGDAASANRTNPVLVSTATGTSSLAGKVVTSIQASNFHSLVIDSTGAVHAWGTNTNGALGDGTTGTRNAPVAVTSLSSHVITTIAAGNYASYALTSLGALYAWGQNTSSLLGDGTTTHRSTPILINGGTLAGKILVAIAASSTHVLALDSTGGLHSWGTNGSGQLGDGSTTARALPISVSTLQGSSSLNGCTVVAITVGQSFSMALDSMGAVHSWGSGNSLGQGSSTNQSFPRLVSTLAGSSSLTGRTVVAIAAQGASAVAALDSNGTVHTWGLNASGQLGDGTTTSRLFPVSTVNTLGSLAGVSLAPVNNPTAITFAPFFVNFTGQHRVFMAAGTDPATKNDGFIVVCDQNEYMAADGGGGLVRGRRAIKINEALPVVSISRKAFDRRVFGVLSGAIQPLSSTEPAQLAEQTYARLREVGDTRVQINSVGEGAIWVSDMGLQAGGNMLSGDLVTSSDLPGYGMAQPDGRVQNYTVAKLTCDCDFTASMEVVEEPRRDPETGMPIIDPVTGNPMWEDVTREAFFDGDQEVEGEALAMLTVEERAALRIQRVPVTEPRYDLRYLDADGKRITREAYEMAKAEDPEAAVYRAAFLGCTYHCG